MRKDRGVVLPGDKFHRNKKLHFPWFFLFLVSSSGKGCFLLFFGWNCLNFSTNHKLLNFYWKFKIINNFQITVAKIMKKNILIQPNPSTWFNRSLSPAPPEKKLHKLGKIYSGSCRWNQVQIAYLTCRLLGTTTVLKTTRPRQSLSLGPKFSPSPSLPRPRVNTSSRRDCHLDVGRDDRFVFIVFSSVNWFWLEKGSKQLEV